MDQITERLRNDGIETSIFAQDEWPLVAKEIVTRESSQEPPEPLVLIGHSYGADNAIRIAETLQQQHVAVDLLITVECVTPPMVPSNVGRAVNIFKPRALDFLPWWRGVPVRTEDYHTILDQIDVRQSRPDIDRPNLGHSDIDKDPKVLEMIEQKVLVVCFSRTRFGAAR